MSSRWRYRKVAAGSGGPAGSGARWIGVLAAGAGLALAGCESPAEPAIGEAAYDYALPVGDAVVYRWPAGATVRVYLHGVGDSARDRLLEEAFGRAASDWAAALGPGVVELARVGDVREADVVVGWSDAPPPVDTRRCAPVVSGRAATTFCPTPDFARLERFPLRSPYGRGPSRVRMVVTLLASEAVGPRRVQQLVAHELGHVLGIGRHSPNPNDLMWDGPLGPVRPSAADRETIRRLYRTPPALVP